MELRRQQLCETMTVHTKAMVGPRRTTTATSRKPTIHMAMITPMSGGHINSTRLTNKMLMIWGKNVVRTTQTEATSTTVQSLSRRRKTKMRSRWWIRITRFRGRGGRRRPRLWHRLVLIRVKSAPIRRCGHPVSLTRSTKSENYHRIRITLLPVNINSSKLLITDILF